METQDTETIIADSNAQEPEKAEATEVKEGASAEAQDGTRFEHVKETLDLLCSYFPKAFIKDGDAKPLKIGIFDDLKAAIAGKEDLSVSKVRAALRLYTTRLRYLFCLKEGAKRVDLEGNEVDVVSSEHAEFAKAKFKEINSKRKGPDKKKNFRKPAGKPGKDAHRTKPRITGIKPELSDLVKGRHVLVLSSEHRYVHGTVADDAQKDSVNVTVTSGMTISMPIDRVLLPLPQKK